MSFMVPCSRLSVYEAITGVSSRDRAKPILTSADEGIKIIIIIPMTMFIVLSS